MEAIGEDLGCELRCIIREDNRAEPISGGDVDLLVDKDDVDLMHLCSTSLSYNVSRKDITNLLMM